MPVTADAADAAVMTLEEAVRGLVNGRDVIVFNLTVRGTESFVADLQGFGARRVLIVAGTEGTGPPLDPQVRRVIVPAPAQSMTEEVLAEEVVVDRMSVAHRRAVDEFDPTERALVLASPFTSATHLGRRPVVGHRPARWAELEDKATIDGLLAAAGVPTPSHEITDPAGAQEAARRLDTGSGVVVAAGGRNGGSDFVRWVAGPDATRVARDLIDAPPRNARGSGLGRVRVATFVEGIPTSIGGFVTDDGVAVMRPVENLTLRRGRRLLYCGVSTLYDPPVVVRSAMIGAARRVGEELRRRVDLRGGFSIDGIVGEEGWVATEVNVRLSGSFATTAGAAGPISGKFVQAVLCSGRDDLSPSASVIESALSPSAEAHRVLRLIRVLPEGPTGPDRCAFRVDGRRAVPTDDFDDQGAGELRLGESALGGLVAGAVQSTATTGLPLGPPGAPLAVSLLDLADERWATDTGGLSPASAFDGNGSRS